MNTGTRFRLLLTCLIDSFSHQVQEDNCEEARVGVASCSSGHCRAEQRGHSGHFIAHIRCFLTWHDPRGGVDGKQDCENEIRSSLQ
jgi:hypothetical protein